MFELSTDLITVIGFIADLGFAGFMIAGLMFMAERHKRELKEAYRRGRREEHKDDWRRSI